MGSLQQVRRPLTGAALSVCAGLAIEQASALSILFWLGCSALLTALLCCRRNTPLLYLACGVLAAAHGAIGRQTESGRGALLQAEVFSEKQSVIGIITDDPVHLDGQVSFRMRTESVELDDARTDDHTTLRVYLKNPPDSVSHGERWQVEGVFSGYTKSRSGIIGTLSASGANARKISPAGHSLTGLCYRFRNRAAALLGLGTGSFPEAAPLLHALLLGLRQAIPEDLYRTFSGTGTLHIFAISGLHVGVMVSILIAALKLSGICRLNWGWALIPLLFLYVLATGMRPSALRAFTMAAVYFAAPLAGRRPDAPSAVALAALLLLARNPGYIGEPGFLLSFVVVSGLIMAHSRAGRLFEETQPPEASAFPRIRLSGNRSFRILLRASGLLLVSSLAAWLFSAPVTACFFNTLAPAALIGNLAVIPLTFMIVLTACLSLLCGTLFLPAAVLFNQANLVFIALLIRSIRLLSLLPGACLTVRAPSLAVTVFWYTGLIFFLIGSACRRRTGLLIFLFACTLWIAEQGISQKDIVILREGRSAAAARLPGSAPGWILATDGNPFHTARTIRLLQKAGVRRLHTLTVTRPEADDEAIRQFKETFRPLFIETANDSRDTRTRSRPAAVEISRAAEQ